MNLLVYNVLKIEEVEENNKKVIVNFSNNIGIRSNKIKYNKKRYLFYNKIKEILMDINKTISNEEAQIKIEKLLANLKIN